MSLRRPVPAVLRAAEADPPRILLVDDDAPWTPPSVYPSWRGGFGRGGREMSRQR